MKVWRCGDCGCQWPKSVMYCPHKLDDYLALRGGSIESAITRAVDAAIAPLVKRAEDRLRGVAYWQNGTTQNWRWTA